MVKSGVHAADAKRAPPALQEEGWPGEISASAERGVEEVEEWSSDIGCSKIKNFHSIEGEDGRDVIHVGVFSHGRPSVHGVTPSPTAFPDFNKWSLGLGG